MSRARTPARLGVVTAAMAALLTGGIGIASAHVSVSSTDAVQGGEGKVVFRVPNESATADTTRIRIQLPTRTPIPSVSIQPVAGWTIKATTAKLDPPVVADDGDKITETVTVVEFDAAKGALPPGQFQEFALSVGPIPKTATLAFPVIQTYSDGTEVAWIDPTIDGAPEPAHPAPVLTLRAAAPATASAAPSAADSHAGHTTTATSSSPAGAALFVALVALAVALAGVVMAYLARRRSVVQ